ncbi:M1 family aminopeptidase [Fulvivirga sedimenti]|uniref:Aminopeptidase N n=1 Tax=Fulvivirga sedimenti TaxID=2879465 RepID=A0A9X1HRR8_9BACT|nr:M1 family aminopeptidase [Fulvivirga sedimenti]MCA6075319.1 T9SS type A sorting domain-containing protein [Fulvivirga sedimenti]MCA6076496.1 T9SS type A sorting domain-containing protein [Fulvivirga sedimenti]MCA6077624.1 T9SS type A sorting domain-containing protein [Fulvivirga sedimenti]
MRKSVLILFLILYGTTYGQDLTPAICVKGTSPVNRPGYASRPLEDSRLHDYDVNFYHLDISADNLSTDLDGSVRILATALKDPLAEMVLELTDALIIDRIEDLSTSSDIPFTHANDLVVITLPDPVTAGDPVDIRIYYHGTPPVDAGFFKGISSELDPDWNRRVTWTLSEPFNALDWWPTKQVLTDKADSAYIYITVPSSLKAGAAGTLSRITELPDNRSRYEWETRHPIAYYLISMAIADYQDYSYDVSLAGQPTFPVVNYIYDHPGTLPQYQDDLDQVGDMLELFSELFGPYPYSDEKYGHTMAPLGGGMEHQTMSTMDFFSFTIDAHELGHQWFGDHITCETWNDIWINEGFARYCEYLAIEFLIDENTARSWMDSRHQSILSAPLGSVYVPSGQADDPFRIFDGRLTYNKGGAILHMLRYLINNDDAFFQGLRTYLSAYGDDVATGEDFRDLMSAETGLDLTTFFNEWYFGQGNPVYDIIWEHRNDSLIVNARQSPSAAGGVAFFTTPMPVNAVLNGSDTLLRLVPASASETFKIYLPGEVNEITFDPDRYLVKRVNSITRAGVTGIEGLNTAGISVYPNPAKGYIQIQGGTEPLRLLQVMDMQGRILLQKENLSMTERTVYTGNLGPGIYLLLVNVGSQRYQQKILIE